MRRMQRSASQGVTMHRLAACVLSTALLVAGCSSGGGKQSTPTTAGVRTTTAPGRASLTVADPSPCSTSTPVSTSTLKSEVLRSKMVPFTAAKVQICRYPIGVSVVGKLLTAAPAVKQLEDATNRLPRLPAARGHRPASKPCRISGSWYFLTFVSDSQRVDVRTDPCAALLTNGVLSARSTPTWLDELERYTPVAIIGTWVPVSIAGFPGPLTDMPFKEALLRFDSRGRWTGNDTCNHFGGSYQLRSGGTFHLLERITTKIRCDRKTPGPPTSAVKADISHDRMRLFGRDGRQVAVYERVGQCPVQNHSHCAR
jgi:META domain